MAKALALSRSLQTEAPAKPAPPDGGTASGALDDPEKLCLESKSLKLYLATYRYEGVFAEALAVKIRDDVAGALELEPPRVRVRLTQKPRGGITIVASA